jgi:DNA helicase-2/ATP-dependent DNA helicase PcrA
MESLGGRSPSWSTPGYPNTYGGASRFGAAKRPGQSGDFADKHYNYEDESQESHRPAAARETGGRNSSSKPFAASWMTPTAKGTSSNKDAASVGTQSHPPGAPPDSIDNIARFFAGKAGAHKASALARTTMDIPAPTGASNLKKGQRVRHVKYGEGTILMREGDGEDAKLTVLFTRHGLKKLMEKFANLQKM